MHDCIESKRSTQTQYAENCHDHDDQSHEIYDIVHIVGSCIFAVPLRYMTAAILTTAAAIPTESTDSPAMTMVSHIISRISLRISFHIYAPALTNTGPSVRTIRMKRQSWNIAKARKMPMPNRH